MPANCTFLPGVEIQDGGVLGYVNLVSYHVGNKTENLLESNRVDAKVGNV